jgi:hypothetical protein
MLRGAPGKDDELQKAWAMHIAATDYGNDRYWERKDTCWEEILRPIQ